MSDYSFSRRRDGTFQVDGCEGVPSVIEIPSEYEGQPVTAIGDNAFSWSYQILKVKIPDSVRVIGEWAFIGCRSLKSIHLPSGLKGSTIPHSSPVPP